MGQNNFLKWLTFPPIIAIATVSIARFMGGDSIVGEVDISIWAMVWILFIVLSFLYGLFIIHGFNTGLIALQAVEQGILLCPLSLVYGARMFEWFGVLLAVCGAAALVASYNQKQLEDEEAKIPKGVENDMRKLPVRFAVTNESGLILNISDDMLNALNRSRDETTGKNIADYFSPVSKTVQLGEKFWDITRKMLDGGRRYYFELKEKGLPTEAPDQESQDENENQGVSLNFIDPVTKLHTYQYGMTRISDDLYRLGRYGRAVSAVLIRIVFPSLLPDEDMSKYSEPFNAYCMQLKKNLRVSDTAIQLDDTQVFVLLSECESHIEEGVTERLLALVNLLCPQFEVFYNVTVLNVSESFESGAANVPTAKALVERLKISMTRKYSANALSE